MTTEYNTTTTLNRIRAAPPCQDGWMKLLSHIGKIKADDEPIDLLTVLDSNGLEDTLWVLSYAMPDDRLARHFQAWCAEQVLHIFEEDRPNDTRVRDQIAMLRNDDATQEQRDVSRNAAWDASWDASWSSLWAAAWAAAWASEFNASCNEARNAAWDAAWATSRDSAWSAAWASECSASLAAQEEQLRKMIKGQDDE